MTSVYSKNLQIYNAEQFKTSIETIGVPNLYLTFGKIDIWPDDNNPPQANTSIDAFNEVWKNMLGAKLIQGNDARLAIRRFDWTSGETYTAYDDCTCSMNMNDANVKFYVVTDEWNVYKCLANNNGQASTVKPNSLDTTFSQQTGDRYIWKYMYTLTDEERLRFTTTEFIPVKTLTTDNGSLQWQVQDNAEAGAIESIKVIDGGSGYSTTSLPIITIDGDGTGANAIANVNATTTAIQSIAISDRGQGYTFANVTITAAQGSGANARALISPPGGHGTNPVEELGGSFVIINPRIRGTESDVLDIRNEFRQIAIIKNPLLLGSNVIASNVAYSQATTVFVDELGDNYIEDEYVIQGPTLETATFKGKVASWEPAIYRLRLIDVSGTISASAPLTGLTSRASRQYRDDISKAFEPYSGSLLYLNNISPIQRSEDQTEDFKIVFSF